MAEFQAVLDPINTECCDEPTEDCSSGYPATCNAGCAAVLLPVQAACADFLADGGPVMKPLKTALDAAAANCPVRATTLLHTLLPLWSSPLRSHAPRVRSCRCRRARPTTSSRRRSRRYVQGTAFFESG